MSEFIPNPEIVESSPIFHATTIENFRTCAVVTGEAVFYEKWRETRHTEPEHTQVLSKLDRLATTYAIQRAVELHSTPVILEGSIDSNRVKWAKHQDGELTPEYTPFPVEYVWVPIPGENWNNGELKTEAGFMQSFYKVFQRIEAKTFLDQNEQQ